jgi:hypothetical protein
MDELKFRTQDGKICIDLNKPTQTITLTQMQAYYFIAALEKGLEKISLQRKKESN